ncbi:MAG: hypothetical protein V3574_04790 [Candidatus Moraniibacteriota bacterium]
MQINKKKEINKKVIFIYGRGFVLPFGFGLEEWGRLGLSCVLAFGVIKLISKEKSLCNGQFVFV